MELRGSGAEIEYVAADVRVEAQVLDALKRSVERFGEVNGVIHAAGFAGEGAYRTIAETGSETCRAHFGPKVGGLAALGKALRESNPDFLLLTSSLSPILGGIGLAAAAATDAWVDSLSHHLNKTQNLKCLSINWEGWSSAAEAAGSSEIGKQQSELIITAEEIAQAFERALSVRKTPQIVVSSGDLHARMAQWTGVKKRQTQKGAAPSSHARQDSGAPYLAPRSETEGKIARVWQQALGVERIGATDDFFELGGNSLVGLQILSQLRAEFQVELPLRSFFEARTVEGMARVIESEHQQGDAEAERVARLLEEIESLSDEEVGRLLAESE
jgi:acyl carrier protein